MDRRSRVADDTERERLQGELEFLDKQIECVTAKQMTETMTNALETCRKESP